jgi:hypothetical protein
MLFQVMKNDHVAIAHTVVWDLSDIRLNLYFVLNFFFFIFCVDLYNSGQNCNFSVLVLCVL